MKMPLLKLMAAGLGLVCKSACMTGLAHVQLDPDLFFSFFFFLK